MTFSYLLVAAAIVGQAAAFAPALPSMRPGQHSSIGLQLRGRSLPVAPARGSSDSLKLVMAGPNIIISGAPASGKGTQCEFIVEKFGVVHISTGDALRDQVKKGTELGNMAKSFMDKGALVPDDVMIGIVRDRLAAEDCKEKGWLLDGFPRTGVQAEAMAQEGIVAEKFVLLNVPDDVLIERCVGRRSDPITGKIYHLKFNPPPNDPEVLGRLVHRNDDTAEAMRSRIKMYNSNVEAIKGYYKPITTEFDGVGDKMQLAAKIADFIAKTQTTIDWDEASAGRNATLVPGQSGRVLIDGSGTIVSKRSYGPGDDFEAEFVVDETGRGSWIGLVREDEEGRLPDLSFSLSAIGWGIWGGETGLFHPIYAKGKVGDQVPGFRAGTRAGIAMRSGALVYFIDGEEACTVWEAKELGGAGGRWRVAVSNGWAGKTRLLGRFLE